MPNNANRRLPPDTLQDDLDCITALKVIQGYAPSNPADTLSAVTDLQTRVAAARDEAVALQNERHERVKSIKNQVRAQFGEDSNEVASIGLKKTSERKAPKRQSRTDGNGG